MAFQMAKVIGHRGACGYAPENTLISMTKAHALGARWVEFDVMLAKNGEPIIIHDLTLDRTTNGTGLVAETDLETILDLDCGSWFSKQFADQRVPTFKDLLRHVSQLELSINVEIKPNPGDEQLTTKKIVEILKTEWPSFCQPPLISSFFPSVLKTASRLDPQFNLGFIIDTWDINWEEILKKNNCISLHVDQRILTRDLVNKVKDKGYLILAYTVNDVKRAVELFEWGVDSIFSDYPDVVLAHLEEPTYKVMI